MAASSSATSLTDEAKEKSFKPYIPSSAELTELSFSAVLLGTLLGVVFGASSLYLFLKVGKIIAFRQTDLPVPVLPAMSR